ncbi:MAG: NAD(P)/FAD-dependent oxidoreductase [Planctomycetes bacterium]|nr:NAD(P)/FAD-dependent oxidoreductase [Planctomycetota bacterium]
MGKDYLAGIEDHYDIIIIGSGLAGLTSANVLAKAGRKVLLLEHHYQYGGLSTWFKRKGGHIFDVSLHGFPVGMIKSCRKYWTKGIADRIEQIKEVRFENPQFNISTTFDKVDFSRILVEHFEVAPEKVEEFFSTLRKMNYYEDSGETTGELFERFFPGRNDITRFLLEPIAYANGSTLEDPAITFGIVFSNFMSKGVYIFKGGTDLMISEMIKELKSNGVELRKSVKVDKILVEDGVVKGVNAGGRDIQATAVLSNASIQGTILKLTGKEHFKKDFVQEAEKVRRNNSSTQVYMGLKSDTQIPFIGDLIFTSTSEEFSSKALVDGNITSRTFSLYYPDMRPGKGKTAIVSSTNAWIEDWEHLSEEEYQKEKDKLIEETLTCLEQFLPDIRSQIDYVEAATPKTFERYTLHPGGASFGTKFEGLKVSEDLPDQLPGLYHAGSVGIIMSGWLGAINYGVIVSNKVDRYLNTQTTLNPQRV